jgi:hypothetical protein
MIEQDKENLKVIGFINLSRQYPSFTIPVIGGNCHYLPVISGFKNKLESLEEIELSDYEQSFVQFDCPLEWNFAIGSNGIYLYSLSEIKHFFGYREDIIGLVSSFSTTHDARLQINDDIERFCKAVSQNNSEPIKKLQQPLNPNRIRYFFPFVKRIQIDASDLLAPRMYTANFKSDDVHLDGYKVAIDILRCHLGMSEIEAMKELGLLKKGKKKHNYDVKSTLEGFILSSKLKF